MNRREFLAGGLSLAAAAAVNAAETVKKPKKPAKDLIWATKWQLGTHDQSGDHDPFNPRAYYLGIEEFQKVDESSLWRRMEKAKSCGVNTILVTVLEALQYPSHPELALKGAWTAEHLHDTMKRVRDEFGIATIPGLNFATSHGYWLGPYSRMVSTPKYYRVCADLIKDVWEVFDHPEIISIGMDEESPDAVNNCYNVVRNGPLYWHDVRFFVETVEKLGARAWCSADRMWWNPKAYCDNVPKSVLQSNWYYSSTFDPAEIERRAAKAGNPHLAAVFKKYLAAFEQLEKAGYDQMPEGSVWLDRLDRAAGIPKSVVDTNFPDMVTYCRGLIAPERLKGFCMTHWIGVRPSGDEKFFHYCDIIAKARERMSADGTGKGA